MISQFSVFRGDRIRTLDLSKKVSGPNQLDYHNFSTPGEVVLGCSMYGLHWERIFPSVPLDIQWLIFEFFTPNDLLLIRKVDDVTRKCVDMYTFLLIQRNSMVFDPSLILERHAMSKADNQFPISIGERHTFLVKNNTDLYAYGNNFYGQLGVRKRNLAVNHSAKITKVDIPRCDALVREVVLGKDTSFLLTSVGSVYSWGKNNSGILGLGHSRIQIHPQRMDFQGEPIVSLNVCERNGIALGLNNTVFVWGTYASFEKYEREPDKPDSEGEFKSTQVPTVFIPLNDIEVDSIACGDGFNVVSTKDGVNVLTWGINNCYNQLGDEAEQSLCLTRVKGMRLGKDRRVKKVACGYSFATTLLTNGEVYTWGDNVEYTLGRTIPTERTRTPHQLRDIPPMKDISCGIQHSLSITKEDGEVYIWGSLEWKVWYNPTKVEHPDPFEYIKCGLYACMAKDERGDVFAWGYNDFKQINPFVDEDEEGEDANVFIERPLKCT